jgi:hypothetical protein
MCFGKLFENMDMDELMERYMKAKRATEGKWYELIQQRVNVAFVICRIFIYNLGRIFG